MSLNNFCGQRKILIFIVLIVSGQICVSSYNNNVPVLRYEKEELEVTLSRANQSQN